MKEGNQVLPDNITQFRRIEKVAPLPQLAEIKKGSTTWVAMTVEEQMTELVGIIAKKTGISVEDLDTLAYSIGAEAIFNYYLTQDGETLHPKIGSENKPK
jgi:hypothetical protein